jgi:hypothetical protein
MVRNTLLVGVAGAAACVAALVAFEAAPVTTAASMAYPCEPALGAPKPSTPKAPTNVRIITGGDAEPESELDTPSGPYVAEEVPSGDAELASYAYFDALSNRADCLAAYHMRTQEQLDSIQTGAKDSPKKQPVTYDAKIDAALFKMYAPSTTDSQQKILQVPLTGNSLMLTWDFRFNEGFRWKDTTYVARHKTWRLDAADAQAWLAMKTDYAYAANKGKGLAEVFMSVPSTKFLAPGATRGVREIPEPRLAEFFIEADRWARVWWLIEDLDKPVCHVSVWMADEVRDAIRLYDRLPIHTTPKGLHPGWFRFEYDTSGDQAANPIEMQSWNRNFVLLQSSSTLSTASLFQRPTR